MDDSEGRVDVAEVAASAVEGAAHGLRRVVKQAAAWRLLAEFCRRHPEHQILEMHGGGGQYDEVVVWAAERMPVRCNFEGRLHIAPGLDAWTAVNWAEVLSTQPRELLGRIEHVAALQPPLAVPKSTPAVLTYRAIAHLAGMAAFDRGEMVLLNGVCDTSGGMGSFVRESVFTDFPGIHGHRRYATPESPYDTGEYRFWFAYSSPAPKVEDEPLLAFETTGHAWKPGPGPQDRFDFNRTYEAVGRQFPRLMAAFDAWRCA